MKGRVLSQLLCCCIVVAFTACSTTKYVPDGEYLLEEVRITSDHPDVKASSFRSYIRQFPNVRWFSKIQVPLRLYSLSTDSTGLFNRIWRRVGEAPVLFNEMDAEKSTRDIRQAVMTYGYLTAQVDLETEIKGKKLKAYYHIHPKSCYQVAHVTTEVEDPWVDSLVQSSRSASLLKEGMALDANVLNAERNRITDLLHNNGYYSFNKDYITFQADTCQGSVLVDITLRVRNRLRTSAHNRYKIQEVDIYTTSNSNDSMLYEGRKLFFQDKLKFRPRVLTSAIEIQPGDYFNQEKVQRSYDNLNRLRALKYANIRFLPVPDDSLMLRCQVLTDHTKFSSLSAELEGTNSAGDLGAAVTATYAHRNVFKGSEVWSFKVRGAYEAITGLEGYSNQDYVELGAETTLSFPRFLFPFLKLRFLQNRRANTEFSVQYNMQNRPEFRRRVATGIWRYRWSRPDKKLTNRFDIIDLNYVYMPWISPTFKEQYLDNLDKYNAILKYNYEDLLIMKMGYSFIYNSQGLVGVVGSNLGTNSYTIRGNIEMAGNLLYGLSQLTRSHRNADGRYTVANIAYAQYIKADFDISKSFRLNRSNSVALHMGVGVAYPYGNATILPFEKRYFSGGANSVRGWNVRTLGPGSYQGVDRQIDYINQSGDIKLDLNAEYRTHLFWKVDGALFVDAGNIWTLRDYSDQPGGQFRFDRFYKQLAASYGLGIRFVFDYFILRFDSAMKAVNPVYTTQAEHYPLFHPRFSRDFCFHFAVGLPF